MLATAVAIAHSARVPYVGKRRPLDHANHRSATTTAIGARHLTHGFTFSADNVTNVAAPMLVQDAYASWCECNIRAGIAQSVSRMIPPTTR